MCTAAGSIGVRSMAAQVKTGYALWYKKRWFGKNWREVHLVLQEDSTLSWYLAADCSSSPEGSLRLNAAPEMIAAGQFSAGLPNRPEFPPGGKRDIRMALAIGSRTSPAIQWLLFRSEQQLMDWLNAISKTLPPPPPPPWSLAPPNGPYLPAGQQQHTTVASAPPLISSGNPAPCYPRQAEPPGLPGSYGYQQGHHQPPGYSQPLPNSVLIDSSSRNQDRDRGGSGLGGFAGGMLLGGALGGGLGLLAGYSGWGMGHGWPSSGFGYGGVSPYNTNITNNYYNVVNGDDDGNPSFATDDSAAAATPEQVDNAADAAAEGGFVNQMVEPVQNADDSVPPNGVVPLTEGEQRPMVEDYYADDRGYFGPTVGGGEGFFGVQSGGGGYEDFGVDVDDFGIGGDGGGGYDADFGGDFGGDFDF